MPNAPMFVSHLKIVVGKYLSKEKLKILSDKLINP